jgi:endonuclease G
MALLSSQEVTALSNALIQGGIDNSVRNLLFQFIDPFYKGTIGRYNDIGQIKADVGIMSDTERLPNGDVPLQIYLDNALPQLTIAPKEQAIVRAFLDVINRRVTGSPRIDIKTVSETKEVIIHKDDTLPYVFMENGLKAARSVAKLRIPAFENGQARKLSNGTDMVGLGSGWLISRTLLITNHHVVNARKEGEPDASEADLSLQGKNTTVIFDFSDEQQTGTESKAVVLEAWNKALDYAILRIAEPGRDALRIATSKLIYKTGDERPPVNIIQHPGGRSKRFAIRNNLISGSTETDLRYFTDTEAGSSGSPVMNDKWEAVALHKGSTYVENVQFQGKSTAYVNIGTHLISILDDLSKHSPALLGEIQA